MLFEFLHDDFFGKIACHINALNRKMKSYMNLNFQRDNKYLKVFEEIFYVRKKRDEMRLEVFNVRRAKRWAFAEGL